MPNPNISSVLKYSFKNTHAIIADAGGTKKNSVTVLLADPLWSKYINIVKAPKETKNIWWLIAIMNVGVKDINEFSKNKVTNAWNTKPPIAWYKLLTGKGKLLVIFFCHNVAAVTEIKEIKAATTPMVGKLEPISKPKTKTAPLNPSITPAHCLQVIFSFKSGPAKVFVSIGCKVTINAAIPVGKPLETEKKTPPK